MVPTLVNLSTSATSAGFAWPFAPCPRTCHSTSRLRGGCQPPLPSCNHTYRHLMKDRVGVPIKFTSSWIHGHAVVGGHGSYWHVRHTHNAGWSAQWKMFGILTRPMSLPTVTVVAWNAANSSQCVVWKCSKISIFIWQEVVGGEGGGVGGKKTPHGLKVEVENIEKDVQHWLVCVLLKTLG